MGWWLVVWVVVSTVSADQLMLPSPQATPIWPYPQPPHPTNCYNLYHFPKDDKREIPRLTTRFSTFQLSQKGRRSWEIQPCDIKCIGGWTVQTKTPAIPQALLPFRVCSLVCYKIPGLVYLQSKWLTIIMTLMWHYLAPSTSCTN